MDLAERLLDFAVGCIEIAGRLQRAPAGAYISNQLVRAASSSGANYQEACAAESRADFIHKMQLVLQELRECLYWLKLASRIKARSVDDLSPLMDEAQQLARMVASSVVTAKARIG